MVDAGEIGSWWASLSRAVAHSVTKILIGAETGDIGGTAAQAASKAKHRGQAVLATLRKSTEILRKSGRGEESDSCDEGLHVDSGWRG